MKLPTLTSAVWFLVDLAISLGFLASLVWTTENTLDAANGTGWRLGAAVIAVILGMVWSAAVSAALQLAPSGIFILAIAVVAMLFGFYAMAVAEGWKLTLGALVAGMGGTVIAQWGSQWPVVKKIAAFLVGPRP